MAAFQGEDNRTGLYRRLAVAFLALLGIVVLGASVYHSLGEGRWAWVDCFYMTVITLFTVGFAETLEGMSSNDAARAWTMTLIVLGSGIILYFASTLTALVVEGDLTGMLRRRRMQRRIDALDSHTVVCGAGSTGVRVIQ